MQVLLVRHGVAEEPGARPDEDRELTREGRRRMRRAARGLAAILSERPSVLATSPLRRARQTAEILAAELGKPETAVLEQLAPLADPRDIADWLGRRSHDELVLLTGHEPHLGRLLTWLACGRDGSRFKLRKGGAALVEISGPAGSGSGQVLWLLEPSHLRALA
jgi:phosphohistidine phosphatase